MTSALLQTIEHEDSIMIEAEARRELSELLQVLQWLYDDGLCGEYSPNVNALLVKYPQKEIENGL